MKTTGIIIKIVVKNRLGAGLFQVSVLLRKKKKVKAERTELLF